MPNYLLAIGNRIETETPIDAWEVELELMHGDVGALFVTKKMVFPDKMYVGLNTPTVHEIVSVLSTFLMLPDHHAVDIIDRLYLFEEWMSDNFEFSIQKIRELIYCDLMEFDHIYGETRLARPIKMTIYRYDGFGNKYYGKVVEENCLQS